MMHFWNILHETDQTLTLFINSLHLPASDLFMEFFSERATWFPLYALVLFFLIKRLGWKKGLIAVAAIALTILACDQTANLLKNSVGRLRPCYSDLMILNGLHVLEHRGSFFGFFSAHAANAFGFAICSTMCFRYDTSHTYNAYFKWALIWAALISISRIFVGKHYLGDITVGAIIGCCWGAIIALCARWLFAKIDTEDSCTPGCIQTK